MVKVKKIEKVAIVLILILAIVSFDRLNITAYEEVLTDEENETSENEDYNSYMINSVVFPHDEVVDVNIEIDEETYEEMIANATKEEYVLADITYNGYTFENVAIRPKGNSSLSQVAASGNDRFSFKVNFDKYIDGQNFFGITKLNLNNIFQDPSLMAEYIGYEILDDIGAVASNTTYVALSINGEYYGLYLSVEQVDETFLMNNYGNYDGTLYKPESGAGADLSYISDDPDDYTAVIPENDDMSTDEHFVELVKTIDEIVKNGGETDEYKLDNILNVDSFLSYLAMSTAVIHLDSYQSGMFHNYYLYYNTETNLFEWITWDLNMTFNGFPQSGLTDEEATQFLIDEPVIGNMSQYPLIEAIFTNDEYVEVYHNYLDEILNGYLDEENFEEKVLEIYTMIEPYAKTDTNPFYTFDETKESLFGTDLNNGELSIIEFVKLRSENIFNQLSGVLPSTNDGNGNSGSGSGRGGMNRGNFGNNESQNRDENGQVNIPEGMAPPEGGNIPEGMAPPEGENIPEGMVPPEEGNIPEGMAPPEEGNIPEGMVPPEEGNIPEGMVPPEEENFTKNMEVADNSTNMIPSNRENIEQGMVPPDRINMAGKDNVAMNKFREGNRMDNTNIDVTSELFSIGISAVLAIGLLVYLKIRKY